MGVGGSRVPILRRTWTPQSSDGHAGDGDEAEGSAPGTFVVVSEYGPGRCFYTPYASRQDAEAAIRGFSIISRILFRCGPCGAVFEELERRGPPCSHSAIRRAASFLGVDLPGDLRQRPPRLTSGESCREGVDSASISSSFSAGPATDDWSLRWYRGVTAGGAAAAAAACRTPVLSPRDALACSAGACNLTPAGSPSAAARAGVSPSSGSPNAVAAAAREDFGLDPSALQRRIDATTFVAAPGGEQREEQAASTFASAQWAEDAAHALLREQDALAYESGISLPRLSPLRQPQRELEAGYVRLAGYEVREDQLPAGLTPARAEEIVSEALSASYAAKDDGEHSTAEQAVGSEQRGILALRGRLRGLERTEVRHMHELGRLVGPDHPQQVLRMLLGFELQAAPAVKKIQEIHKWRNEHGLDSLRAALLEAVVARGPERVVFPHQDALERLLRVEPCCFRTRLGWPISIFHFGTLRGSGGSCRPLPDPDVLAAWSRSFYEYVDCWISELSDRTGRLAGHIQVLNFAGGHFRHLWDVALMERVKASMGAVGFYVESVLHTYLVNAPSTVSVGFRMAKGYVAPRAQSKITVDRGIPEALLALVDPEAAPRLEAALRSSPAAAAASTSGRDPASGIFGAVRLGGRGRSATADAAALDVVGGNGRSASEGGEVCSGALPPMAEILRPEFPPPFPCSLDGREDEENFDAARPRLAETSPAAVDSAITFTSSV
eukprot:TRINITY_DN21630_c0_g1_i1.p1 TRINITY_DN21630_c0_g1~~TRINITY_DN21630_c0_g1_i1.p1  ORF type:complete len:802 (-),score=134.96 TRINITY_DN21630_c0_g1_i1:65-2239(-)